MIFDLFADFMQSRPEFFKKKLEQSTNCEKDGSNF